MKILEITSNKDEPTLESYLKRTCGAWTKKRKIYFPIEQSINYFGSKITLKSFLNHSANGRIQLREKNINLDNLTTLEFAEIIFGNEAINQEDVR